MPLDLPYGRKLPKTVNCLLHNADTNTSGGAAAVAASLAAGQKGVRLASANQLAVERDLLYLGFVYADEQSTAADADGYITIGNKRALELPLELTNEFNCMESWMNAPLKLANDERIDVVGRSTGAGAEQHTAIHYVDDPALGEGFDVKPGGSGETSVVVAQVTAALVANTISGFTDICGRTTAYVGAQRAIPNDKDIEVILHAITPFASAGYSGIAIRPNKQDRQLILMANGGGATGGVTANMAAQRFDLDKIFGGGLACKADKPLQLGAFGVGTTAQWALLEMELVGVGKDG